MKWTKKKPNKPGHYWLYDGGFEEIYMVEVERDSDGDLYATAMSGDIIFNIDKSYHPTDKWCFVPRPK